MIDHILNQTARHFRNQVDSDHSENPRVWVQVGTLPCYLTMQDRSEWIAGPAGERVVEQWTCIFAPDADLREKDGVEIEGVDFRVHDVFRPRTPDGEIPLTQARLETMPARERLP
jgi:hypothetical protein